MVKRQSASVATLLARAVRSPRGAVGVLSNYYDIRASDLDIDTFVDTLADVSGADPETVRSMYDECVSGTAMRRYERALDDHLTPFSSAALYKRFVGPVKYARLDRIALYCLVRLSNPQTVVETGVNWGESTLFILEALQQNGQGELYSFDAGFNVASEHYPMPPNVDQVGFLVTDDLREQWTLVIGDSIEEMEETLPGIPSVDLFYHDSLHSYDHMTAEFEIACQHMSDGGLFMSEDIDNNDAWEDFHATHSDELVGDYRYYSMQGIETKREIGATVVSRGSD